MSYPYRYIAYGYYGLYHMYVVICVIISTKHTIRAISIPDRQCTSIPGKSMHETCRSIPVAAPKQCTSIPGKSMHETCRSIPVATLPASRSRASSYNKKQTGDSLSKLTVSCLFLVARLMLYLEASTGTRTRYHFSHYHFSLYL